MFFTCEVDQAIESVLFNLAQIFSFLVSFGLLSPLLFMIYQNISYIVVMVCCSVIKREKTRRLVRATYIPFALLPTEQLKG